MGFQNFTIRCLFVIPHYKFINKKRSASSHLTNFSTRYFKRVQYFYKFCMYVRVNIRLFINSDNKLEF